MGLVLHAHIFSLSPSGHCRWSDLHSLSLVFLSQALLSLDHCIDCSFSRLSVPCQRTFLEPNLHFLQASFFYVVLGIEPGTLDMLGKCVP